jgi:hypothetical protein
VRDPATPAAGRGSALHPEWARAARSLAIARAARDEHRSSCEFDAQDCPRCHDLAAAIRKAKEALRLAPVE